MSNKVVLTVDKKFLQNYRQYKLDLIDSTTEPVFEYTALTQFLHRGNSLSDLLSKCKTDETELELNISDNSIKVIDNYNDNDKISRMLDILGS